MGRGKRHREIAGEHPVYISDNGGTANTDDTLRRPEPGARKRIFVPIRRLKHSRLVYASRYVNGNVHTRSIMRRVILLAA